MADETDTFDFDFEDSIQLSPPKKKKKKLIGLDDLLDDFYKEQHIKLAEKKSKRAKVKIDKEDENDHDDREAELSKFVGHCEDKMTEIGGDDEMPLWGIQVFGKQKTFPEVVTPDIKSTYFWKSITSLELNSMVGLQSVEDKGEKFLEGLLVDGWLLKLVVACKKVEKPIAMWTFDLMIYSTSAVFSAAAYDFWKDVLSLKNERIEISWLPGYFEVKNALDNYGFLFGSPSISRCNKETLFADPKVEGPQNITALIKFLAVCFHSRKHLLFSTSEVEDIVVVIICLFLDRQLLGLSEKLNQCLASIVSYFQDDEWRSSSDTIAKSIACRLPKDINCLRTVESISGVDGRLKQLRSAVAFEFLVLCFDSQSPVAEEILRLVMSINVRDKTCDLLNLYIYIGLAENWLLCNPATRDKPVIREMWNVCLKNCSCHISNTDLRSYASKLRSKASYLLQGIDNK
ncbi:hypothetical protein Leryth_002790 [Lithospermum erythrorhizon]|nr:hypothetical protein Leryth_002790 [Lithospermum erythrorhizon]